MFGNPVTVMPYTTSKRLRPLAITSKERLPAMSDVPTMAEGGQKDLVIGFWNGVLAPAGTPAPIVTTLSDALMKIIKQPHVQEALNRQGSVIAVMGDRYFAEFVKEDSARWAGILQTIDFRLD
jgi:tripartite-type tricarboxylate transporter receptor subunit TctC